MNVKNGLYKHYKGNTYQVIGVARHSETKEELVVYKALYATEYGENSLWVRPKSMFTESIQVKNKIMQRFTYQETDE